MTPFLSNHPGGKKLVDQCLNFKKDITEFFKYIANHTDLLTPNMLNENCLDWNRLAKQKGLSLSVSIVEYSS